MAKTGTNFKIYVTTVGTPDTHTLIGGNLSASLTVNNAIVDVSSKDSEWTEKLAGQKDWSVSGSFNLDDLSTSQQVAIYTAMLAGTAVKIFIGEIVNSAIVYGYKGDAVIESVSISGDKDAAVTKDISFQGTGALTAVPEAAPTTTTTTVG